MAIFVTQLACHGMADPTTESLITDTGEYGLEKSSSGSTFFFLNSLHRTANGLSLKRNYATMRSIGILLFEDFLRDDLQELLPSHCLFAWKTACIGNSLGSTVRI